MHKLLGSMINKFDAEAKNHMERQSLNPFSGNFSRSPSPRLSKDQYGKPLAGSKTEERGQKAKCHILREIQDLCNCIHDLGVYNKSHKQKDDDDSGDEDKEEDEIIITFGEIFQMYTKINDKVVGLLIAAKKRGFIFFDKEILFQRRDDDVLIALIKPIKKIREIINRELQINSSPSSMSSRGASPAVTDSSESDKVNGTMTNGTAGGSSKSSSNSPDKEVKKASIKSQNKIEKGEPTKDQKANGIVHNKEKEISNNSISQNKDNATLEKQNDLSHPVPTTLPNDNATSETNENPPPNELAEINTISISLVPTEPELSMNQEIVINEERQPDETPELDLKLAVPEAETIPELEVSETSKISETPESNINIELNSNQTSELTANLIPTIEISECENSEEELVKTDEATPDEAKPVEKTDDKINDSGSSCITENDDNKTNENVSSEITESSNEELNENVTVDSAALPEKLHEELPVSTDIVEPPINDISELLDNQELIQVNSSNDNERKRTFSNEELIESLTAALSGRSSSPDICDEEVEQILQSQNAASAMFNESPAENTNNTEVLLNNDYSPLETPIKESPSEIIAETPSSITEVNGEVDIEPKDEQNVEANVEANVESKVEEKNALNKINPSTDSIS